MGAGYFALSLLFTGVKKMFTRGHNISDVSSSERKYSEISLFHCRFICPTFHPTLLPNTELAIHRQNYCPVDPINEF